MKAFPVFNVLETCRVYLLVVDLGIIKFIKKFIEWFFEKCEICRRDLYDTLRWASFWTRHLSGHIGALKYSRGDTSVSTEDASRLFSDRLFAGRLCL